MEYQKCLVELDEILNHLEEKSLEEIPYEIKNAIQEKKDKKYTWHYDESKNLSEQKINRKTIAMLSYLSMEYLLNEEQKMELEKIHEINEREAERRKQEIYNPDNIFKTKIIENKQPETILIQVKNEKWYKKIISFVKEKIKIHK